VVANTDPPAKPGQPGEANAPAVTPPEPKAEGGGEEEGKPKAPAVPPKGEETVAEEKKELTGIPAFISSVLKFAIEKAHMEKLVMALRRMLQVIVEMEKMVIRINEEKKTKELEGKGEKPAEAKANAGPKVELGFFMGLIEKALKYIIHLAPGGEAFAGVIAGMAKHVIRFEQLALDVSGKALDGSKVTKGAEKEVEPKEPAAPKENGKQ